MICRPPPAQGAPYNVRTMSSIAGSSSVRSMTSVIAVTSARTRAAVVCCGLNASRCRWPSSSLPIWVAARDTEVGTRLRQVDDEHTLQRHPRSQARQRPVEDQAAVVDHEHSLAEPLDVTHVVRGQQQRGAELCALGKEKVTQPLLADHVQSDGRLVEDKQPRAMDQGRGHLATHPLAKGKLAYGDVQQVGEAQALHQLLGSGRGFRGRHSMDRAQNAERVAQRKVPPQLAALPKHHPDLTSEQAPLRHRVVAAGTHSPAGRDEDAGQHLDRGGLTGAVGPDVADRLPGQDRRGDPVDGVHDPGLPAHPPDLLPHGEGAVQVLERDDRFVAHISHQPR